MNDGALIRCVKALSGRQPGVAVALVLTVALTGCAGTGLARSRASREHEQALAALQQQTLHAANHASMATGVQAFREKAFEDGTSAGCLPLAKLITALATKWEATPDQLPRNESPSGLFAALTDLSTIPGKGEACQDVEHKRRICALLKAHNQLAPLYGNLPGPELATLTDGIGRLACVTIAEKEWDAFESVSADDLEMGGIRAGISAFALAAGRHGKRKDYENMLAETRANAQYRDALTLSYKSTPKKLIAILGSDRADDATRDYVRSRLRLWIKPMGHPYRAIIEKALE